MKIFDGEFFADSTVVVFKEYSKKEYDVFIGCKIKYNLKIPKCTFYKLSDLKDYLIGQAIVGFNNQNFDNQVITKITKGVTNPIDIYDYSQKIISNPNRNFREYYDDKLSFIYLDLFKINHYDNPARSTSLKKLEFNYRRKKIMDLPFHHTSLLKNEKELEEIVRYCMEDVGVTEECYNNSKKAVKFREELSKEYNKSMMNLSDSSIGAEIGLTMFCKNNGYSENYIKKQIPKYPSIEIKFADCIPSYISFETPELQSLLSRVKNKIATSTKEFKEKINFGDAIITLGQGGIHTEDSPRLVVKTDDYSINDCDITSMYPAEMIKRKLFPRHLNESWSNGLRDKYYERSKVYKPLAKKDPTAKLKSDAIKLILNSTFGKTNSEFSWQYDPLVTMSVTIGGQFMILMLIERFVINNIKLISANTDGILVYLHKSQEELYNKICKEWAEEVGNIDIGELEFTEYNFIAQLSVNDYIAKTMSGELKRKGSFLTYEDIKADMWHKDSSAMIIPFALQEYFVNNISPETTINDCNNIFEFCYGSKKQKAAKKGHFKWLISEVNENKMVSSYLSEDRFMRYYIGGNTTINKLYDDYSISNLSTKENPVTVAQYLRREEIIKGNTNAYPELNKDFYINEAAAQINLIMNNILKL